MFLLCTCFRGHPKQGKEVAFYDDKTKYKFQQGSCAGVGNGSGVTSLSVGGYVQETPSPSTAYNGVRVHCHAGGHAGSHGTYDACERCTPGVPGIPSFTLSAIAEDEADEEGSIGSYPGAANALNRGAAPSSIGGADGCCMSKLAFDFDYITSEQCAFAIIPPAPLSTVFEESDSEEVYAPSGSCYSAEAGCASANNRLASASLVRGLSAPACGVSPVPLVAGAVNGSCAPVACMARTSPLPLPPLQCETPQPPPLPPSRTSPGSAGTTATHRAGSYDPLAVWYF